MKIPANQNAWQKWGRVALTRMATVYAAAVLALVMLVDVPTIYRDTLAATLNRLIPDFTYFVEFTRKGESFDPSRTNLPEHFHYYQYVQTYRPNDPDVQAMLGFTAHYMGLEDLALKACEKSVALNPRYFWTRYNLGVLYYLQGDLDAAYRQLSAGLETALQDNLDLVSSSRIYFPMLVVNDELPDRVKSGLKNGFRDAYSLSMVILEKQRKYPEMVKRANSAIVQGMDNDGRFYYYSAMAAYQLNRPVEAAGILTEGLKRFPNHRKANSLLAEIFRRQGRNSRAVLLETKAAHIPADFPSGLATDEGLELRIY